MTHSLDMFVYIACRRLTHEEAIALDRFDRPDRHLGRLPPRQIAAARGSVLQYNRRHRTPLQDALANSDDHVSIRARVWGTDDGAANGSHCRDGPRI